MSQDASWTLVQYEKKRRKTFLLSVSAGLDYSQLRKQLCNWNEIYIHQVLQKSQNQEIIIDLIYIDGNHTNKSLYNVKCIMKNLLNDEKKVITDKANLYNNMKDAFPEITQKYFASTRNLEDVHTIQNGEVLIIKPVGRGLCSGKHITIITNDNELGKVKTINKKYNKCIATNYIKNPLLWNNKKFHVRSYMLVTSYPYTVKLFHRSKIFTARNNYVEGEYCNPHIHDTHISSTPKNIYFPEEFPATEDNKQKVIFQMNEVVHYLGKLMEIHAKPYPESKYAFEVFGIDFLITNTFDVIIMEVNDKIGLKCIGTIDQKYSDFSREYFKWIYDNAIVSVLH